MGATVRMQHVRAAGMALTGKPFCARGVRAWFAGHDLDWMTFLRGGVPAQQAIDTGDALAIKAAEIALEETRNG